MTSPEAIQTEIDRTRAQLSSNVDRLTDKVSPGRVVSRRVDKVKDGASSMRDRVMGSTENGSGLRGTGDSLSGAADSLKDSVGSAPHAVRNQTQGNPLAVGVIAFGVGWLLSSLAPATAAEQQLAGTVEAKARELAEPLKDVGQQIAADLKQPAQEAVEQVKSTATDAAVQTADQAKSAAQDVKAPLQQ